MKRWLAALMVSCLAGSSAQAVILSSNLIPAGSFDDSTIHTFVGADGNVQDQRWYKFADSPRNAAEVAAGSPALGASLFHSDYDLGRWIAPFGAVSAEANPRTAFDLGQPVGSINRSTITRDGQSTGILEGAAFRGWAVCMIEAPANQKTGTAKLDFDYYFNYWDPVNLDETPQLLQAVVLGVPADALPGYASRWGAWNNDVWDNTNPIGDQWAENDSWVEVYRSASWNSQAHAADLAGNPWPGYGYLPSQGDQWQTYSDGVTDSEDVYHDGTFTLNQTFPYYLVIFRMVVFSEGHMNFWLLGNKPTDTMSVAIDNVSLQVRLPYPPGDFNGDGVVTLSDINPFKLALTDPVAWQAQYPDVPLSEVDPNGDGLITLSDINPFKAILTGGSAAEVPEPASLSLLAVGALALWRRRA
ncbi:MAG: PEP-CTERM sorting domain-containing protein [Phycisphaeraceae bacterium]|nr:PEP-CTERM sorting domain-containing protein [Phycisphaeraceae bacterium]